MALTKVSRGLLSTGIVDNSTTTAITINSSENVGVGTSSPSAGAVGGKVIHVQNSGGTASVRVDRSDATTSGTLSMTSANGSNGLFSTGAKPLAFSTNSTERMRIDSSGNVGIGTVTTGSYRFNALRSDGNTAFFTDGTTADLFIKCTGGVSTISPTTGILALGTSSTERMRIDSSGNLLVGTTSGGARLRVTGAAGASASIFQVGINGYPAISFNNTAGVQQGYIVTTASAVSLVSVSDQRLKENIADADDAGSKVDSIQVRKFDWKVDGSHQDYGMVAQELQIVAPEAVHQPADSEEMMGVDYSKLVPMLVKEIQSLRSRVAQLENN